VWFGDEERPLFGWFCAPDDQMARAVVIACNPIGSECDNAQVAFDALAQRLVGLGMGTLRFDYDGTGDSAGSWTDGNRLGSWMASIRSAVAFARSMGVAKVAVVGMRMGALLSVAALHEDADVDAIVLWDPCSTGRQFLREQALLLSAAFGQGQPSGGAAEGPATYYESEAATSISEFDPLPGAQLRASSVLVLTREGRSIGGSLKAMARVEGMEWATVRGQADLLDVPGISDVDDDDLDLVAQWLAGHVEEDRHPVTVDSPDSARIPTGGSNDVVERAIEIGDIPLFAIRCDPHEGGGAPTVVFLTAGLLHRCGPARMWTDLARRWAALGVPSIRVDVSGGGHSGTRPGQTPHLVMAPEAIDDLARIAEGLGSADGSGLVYVGLSTGGYLAVEAGLQFRPLGVCPLNPSLSIRLPVDASASGIRRRAHRRILFHDLRRRHNRIASWLAWAATQVLIHRSPAGPLVQAARRGSKVLVVVTRDEATPLRWNLFWRTAGRRVRRTGAYQFVVLPGSDHSLYLRTTREPAMEAMTEWVLDLQRQSSA
jgi:alpha-beta hydrolase superfamily lysophospholipase